MRSDGRPSLWLVAATLVAASIGARSSSAAPIVYAFASGSITLSASVLGNAIMAPATLPLDGVQVLVDDSVPALNSFQLTLSNANLSLTTPYAGYDTIHIDFASISAGAGTLTPLPPAGNPQEYAFLVAPVAIAGQVDATGSSPAIVNAPFGFTNPSASGSIFLDTQPGSSTLSLDGITLGAIQPAGASAPLVLKADLQFVGTAGAAIPEPAAALLFGGGFGIVSARLRRRVDGSAGTRLQAV